jgi:hypothetical protein
VIRIEYRPEPAATADPEQVIDFVIPEQWDLDKALGMCRAIDKLIKTWWGTGRGSRFATGGVIPDSGGSSDSVPVMLNPGCGYLPDQPRPAQHVEITALADLPDRVCLCGARWRGDQEHP